MSFQKLMSTLFNRAFYSFAASSDYDGVDSSLILYAEYSYGDSLITSERWLCKAMVVSDGCDIDGLVRALHCYGDDPTAAPCDDRGTVADSYCFMSLLTYC